MWRSTKIGGGNGGPCNEFRDDVMVVGKSPLYKQQQRRKKKKKSVHTTKKITHTHIHEIKHRHRRQSSSMPTNLHILTVQR